MTAPLLGLVPWLIAWASGVIRQIIREELRALLAERRVSDRAVARHFSLHVKTWQRWVRESAELQAVGLWLATPGGRGRWRWRIRDVEDWLQRNRPRL